MIRSFYTTSLRRYPEEWITSSYRPRDDGRLSLQGVFCRSNLSTDRQVCKNRFALSSAITGYHTYMYFEKRGYVYILASGKNGTIYVGFTSHLVPRVWQHKQHILPNSFTARYDCTSLVYYEIYDRVDAAIAREKQIKGGSRNKKIQLIQKENPEWRDLYEDLLS